MKQQAISKITIPCHWSYPVIDQIIKNNCESNGIKVSEVYGVLASGGPVGHGRSRDSVVNVLPDEAITFRQYLGQNGLRFSYLLNAPFTFRNDPEQKRELDQYLDWVLRALKPDALTISSLDLMRYVRSRDEDVPIHISTIAGVKTPADLDNYLEVRPKRVVPHHDLGKDWTQLAALYKYAQERGIEAELLVTESCLYQCPSRTAHYEYLARGVRDKSFHTTCNFTKLTNPSNFLLAGGTTRPEDLEVLESMGVSIFKISGRSKPAEWLPETALAYQQRKYEGNLIRLLGIDPTLEAENWLFIDNDSLGGFLSAFPGFGTDKERRTYCERWVRNLYEEGRLRLNDGTEYTEEEGQLKIVGEGGSIASKIIRRECL